LFLWPPKEHPDKPRKQPLILLCGVADLVVFFVALLFSILPFPVLVGSLLLQSWRHSVGVVRGLSEPIAANRFSCIYEGIISKAT